METRNHPAGRDVILLVFTVVTWGYSWVMMKVGIGYMSSFTFATWRCLIGGVAMVPLLVARRLAPPPLRKWPDYILFGLLQTTGLFGFVLYGLRFVTAGKTAVLLYTMPIWTSLLTHFLLGEKLRGVQWLGIASGAVGLLSIMGWDTLIHQNPRMLFGETMIVCAALSWALANLVSKVRMKGEDPLTANGLQLLIGTAGLALITWLLEGSLLHVQVTPVSLFTLLFTGIIASTVNFAIWFHLLHRLNTHTLAFSVMLVPVCGLLFDSLQLGSRLDAGTAAGGGLILLGIYLIVR